jgi:DNA primase
MNSPATAVFNKSNCVYGLNLARHNIVSTSTVIVVEGYTDVIMCHQFGCNNVVATLGTSFTEGHARLLRRFASNIVLIFDSDIAGTEAANRALEVCLSQKIDIKIASVPQGKDPCDYLLAAGVEAFNSVIKNAVDVMQYKWDRLKAGLENSTNLTDRKNAVEQYIDSVSVGINSGNIDPITAGLIVSKISRITGIEANRLRNILRKKVSRIASGQSYAVEDQKVVSVKLDGSITAKSQQEILEVLLAKPELYENIKEKIKAQVFDIPIFRDIFHAFVKSVSLGYNDALARTIANLEQFDISNTVVELESKGKSKANFEKRISDCIDALIEHRDNDISEILQMEDEDEKLKKQMEIAKKTNLRKIGLVNI